MKNIPKLSAEKPATFFSNQYLTSYDPEPDLKTILESVISIQWNMSATAGMLCFKFDNHFPDPLRPVCLRILTDCLTKNLIPYDLINQGNIIILKKRITVYSYVKSYFDCASKDRIIKFKNEFSLRMSEIIWFYDINIAREEQLQEFTSSNWKSHFEFKTIPPRVYFSTEAAVNIKPLRNLNFYFSVGKKGLETVFYPTTVTKVTYNPRELDTKLYPFRDLLTIFLPKLLCLTHLIYLPEYMFNIPASALWLYYSKVIIAKIDRYLLEFLQSKSHGKFSFIAKETVLTPVLFLIIYLVNRLDPGKSCIILLDYLFDILFLDYGNEVFIQNHQLDIRHIVKNSIQYFFPDKNLEFHYDRIKYLNLKPITKIINLLNGIIKISGATTTSLIEVNSPVTLTIKNKNIFSNEKDKILLKIICDIFGFFQVDVQGTENEIIFTFPFIATSLNQLEYYKTALIIIENQYKIHDRLISLKMNLRDFKFVIRANKVDQIQYWAAISVENIKLAPENAVILKENFNKVENGDQFTHYFELTDIKSEYQPVHKKSDQKSDHDGQKILEDLKEPTLPETTIAQPKNKRTKLLVSIDKKAQKIIHHLRSKARKITINYHNRIIKVCAPFEKLEEFLDDFNTGIKKINRGFSISFSFQLKRATFTIKVLSTYVDSKPKLQLLAQDQKKQVTKAPLKASDAKGDSSSEEKLMDFKELKMNTGLNSNLSKIVTQLILNFSEKLYEIIGIRYAFSADPTSLIYKFLTRYISFSYLVFNANPIIADRIYGGLPFFLLTQHLMKFHKELHDMDIAIDLTQADQKIFSDEDFLNTLIDQSNKMVKNYRKTPLAMRVYTVKMPGIKVIDVRFTAKDFQSDAQSLNFPCKAISFSIDWQASCPRFFWMIPDVSQNFVKCLQTNTLPDFEVIQNIEDLKLLNHSKLRKLFYYMLIRMFPKHSKDFKDQIKIFRQSQKFTISPKLKTLVLSLLHLIADVKRIFQAFGLMELITFKECKWLDFVAEYLLPEYFRAAELCYIKKVTTQKQYSFKELIYKEFSKYIIYAHQLDPSQESINRCFWYLRGILYYRPPQEQKTSFSYRSFFCDRGEFIVQNDLMLQYYRNIMYAMVSQNKLMLAIEALLVVFTLTLTHLFLTDINLKYPVNKPLDLNTHIFVCGNILFNAFKKQLQTIANSMGYPLNAEMVFSNRDQFNFQNETITEILVFIAQEKIIKKGDLYSAAATFAPSSPHVQKDHKLIEAVNPALGRGIG
ncbi:MAG: hypothetical protein JSR33_01895 [Proteobacteria bacterium]|nr:hypothetical protein [Pseudomonadota bacterium]